MFSIVFGCFRMCSKGGVGQPACVSQAAEVPSSSMAFSRAARRFSRSSMEPHSPCKPEDTCSSGCLKAKERKTRLETRNGSESEGNGHEKRRTPAACSLGGARRQHSACQLALHERLRIDAILLDSELSDGSQGSGSRRSAPERAVLHAAEAAV